MDPEDDVFELEKIPTYETLEVLQNEFLWLPVIVNGMRVLEENILD
jgi:hypothetical protein